MCDSVALRACGRTASAEAFLILFVGAWVLAGCSSQPEPEIWPTEGWTASAPENEDLDATPLSDLDRRIRGGEYGYVDRMVVVRNGRLVINHRYENDYREISRGHKGVLGCGTDACDDESALHEFNYFHPDWHPYYQGGDVHTLQSVTKSITSVLIGVAIGRGEIPDVDAPLLSFFKDYDLSGVDARLQKATLGDLLTMRTGIEWHEVDRPLDETNTTLQLEWSADWIQFTLDQSMDSEPGEKWAYNSGGSHLMSGILKKATGKYADEFAEAYLFGPLGIGNYHWKKTPKGFPDTEGGLFLEAEQLAKIGYLFLKDGVWDGKRILPEGWVDASTERRVAHTGYQQTGYGYQWWRPDRDGVDVWAGFGFGGQYLLVLPKYDLIGVVNSWNIFGGELPSIRDAFLDALVKSVKQN